MAANSLHRFHGSWPRKWSGTGQTDRRKHWHSWSGFKQAKVLIQGPCANKTRNMLNLNRDQLQWVVGLLTRHCPLKGTPFQVGFNKWSHQRKMPRKRSSHTHPMWFWCNSLHKISSLGSLFHGTKRLPWHPNKESPELWQKCRIDREINKKVKHDGSWKSQWKGWTNLGPLFTHAHT
jgi:hypothetical protein